MPGFFVFGRHKRKFIRLYRQFIDSKINLGSMEKRCATGRVSLVRQMMPHPHTHEETLECTYRRHCRLPPPSHYGLRRLRLRRRGKQPGLLRLLRLPLLLLRRLVHVAHVLLLDMVNRLLLRLLRLVRLLRRLVLLFFDEGDVLFSFLVGRGR